MSVNYTDPVFPAEMCAVKKTVKIVFGGAAHFDDFNRKTVKVFAKLPLVMGDKDIMFIFFEVGLSEEIQEVGFHAPGIEGAEDMQDSDLVHDYLYFSNTAL